MTPVDEHGDGFQPRPDGTAPEPAGPPPCRSADAADIASRIARLERLVEQEIAAEEAVRAGLDALPRSRTEAEKTARTLANLTHTLNLLQRMRAGLPAALGPDDHDNMPGDFDEFRHALAGRIEDWAASRIGRGDGAGDSGTGVVEEIQ